MGPQMYNPSPNMMGQPNNGYGAPQTANYYNPYYVNPNFNQQVPIQPRPDYLAGRVVSSEKDIRPNANSYGGPGNKGEYGVGGSGFYYNNDDISAEAGRGGDGYYGGGAAAGARGSVVVTYYALAELPVRFNGTQLTKLIYNGTTVEHLIYNGQQLY